MVQATVEDSLPNFDIPKTNILLAVLVKWLHISIVVFTGIGWMLPWPQAWQLLLVLVPAMKLHWVTNNQICFLTTLENRLRGIPNAGSAEQGGFVHQLIKALLGKYSPSEKVVSMVSEYGMYVGWLIAALRLFVLS